MRDDRERYRKYRENYTAYYGIKFHFMFKGLTLILSQKRFGRAAESGYTRRIAGLKHND